MAATEAPPAQVPDVLLDAPPAPALLPLPRFADEADACYAIRREGEEGFTCAIPVEAQTEIAHDLPERARIYPTYEPGHKYTADYHDGAPNVLVKVRVGAGTKYAWLDDVLGKRSHAGPVKVTRRAWQPITHDVRQWEDPQAALAQNPVTKPVVEVVGWCPLLDKDPEYEGTLKPHGRVYGVDEKPPGKKYGKGFCARCASDRVKQADARAKIARLRAGEKV